jgi:hypothetical protein
MPGRNKFLIVRTGCSPPVAPHHALLRPSYIRLRAGERLPEEDFHLSIYLRFLAHPSSLTRRKSVSLVSRALKDTAKLTGRHAAKNKMSELQIPKGRPDLKFSVAI